jgi:hypothetical protein
MYYKFIKLSYPKSRIMEKIAYYVFLCKLLKYDFSIVQCNIAYLV